MEKCNCVNGGIQGVAALLGLVIVLFSAVSYAADEAQSEESAAIKDKGEATTAPYCGLHCLYAIMKMSGKVIDYRELVRPQYVGSRKGSSLAELGKAAEDHGLHAQAVSKLTIRGLARSSYPVILHVKPRPTSAEYDHYELFLGTKAGKAVMFNPPEPVQLVTFAELAPRWNGNGLIVSTEAIDSGAMWAAERRRFALWAAVAITGVALLRLAQRHWPGGLFVSWKHWLGLSAGQGIALSAVALVFASVYHFVVAEGFLARAGATEGIQRAHGGNFIPRVSANTVHDMLGCRDTILVDARYKHDFEAGHLEGAISVPVNTMSEERRKTLANVARDAKIVVYCQSAGCQFAESVAVRLKDDGFSNVSIFRGGWDEWSSRNRQERKSNP